MSTSITQFNHLRIPLEEILKATNNFSENNIIGKGGLGNIYKGQLLRSGELINVSAKRLDHNQEQGDVEFWREISILSSLKHPNIVYLIGFCDEEGEKIIINHLGIQLRTGTPEPPCIRVNDALQLSSQVVTSESTSSNTCEGTTRLHALQLADNNMAKLHYANSYVVLNLGKSLKNYKSFLIRMRKLKRSLPNHGEFTSDNLCNIIVKYGGRKLTVKMNTHDFYLYGYKDNVGTMWEMRKPRDAMRLRGSTPTNVGVTHPKINDLKTSKDSLITAFNHLDLPGQSFEIAKDFAQLCFVLSEASRFEPISTQFGHALWRGKEVVFDGWIEDLVKHWEFLSSIAASCNEENIVLTHDEIDMLKSRRFIIFFKKGGEYISSQRRIAKVIIAVAHLP
ncbi:protein kinase-like domain, concanavalin A-like lectin/glucanase domain protein [Tanacetum coccineum]